MPGTSVEIRLRPVPPGEVEAPDPESPERMVTVAVGPLLVGETEVTWDLYDVFVYRLDEPAGDTGGADAVSRPSKPYVPPDRGFGHDGYPAMGMTFHAAQEFCRWLSEKTGRTYRLPTEAEWEYLARAGSKGPYCFGEDATRLGEFAWTAANAEWTTHPVGEKAPNGFGLLDVHGNVAEWAVRADGSGTACGGSYLSEPDDATLGSRLRQTSAWNASDPQIPKSRWWLADCSFVGFRVVCEPPSDQAGEDGDGDDDT